MKKCIVILLTSLLLISVNVPASAKTVNETDTDLREAYKYALINSLREPVDKAIDEIYKEDQNSPEGLTWASYMTEIIKIKQLYGVGGLYEVTLKVTPYYEAHNTYGEDIIRVNTDGELIDYKHVKTYPKVEKD